MTQLRKSLPGGGNEMHRDVGAGRVVLDYIVICSLLHEGETFSPSHQQTDSSQTPDF